MGLLSSVLTAGITYSTRTTESNRIVNKIQVGPFKSSTTIYPTGSKVKTISHKHHK